MTEVKNNFPYKAIIISLFIFCFFLGLTFLNYNNLQNDKLNNFQTTFDDELLKIAHQAEAHKAKYENLLYAAKSLFAASNSVERNEWKIFYEAITQSGEYPAVAALAYIEKVDKKDLKNYISSVQSDKNIAPITFPNYKIFPFRDKDTYYPIKYVEPMDQLNLGVPGFDIAETPQGAGILEYARDNNAIALTEEYNVQFLNDRGFVAILPIFTSGKPHDTEFERSENLEGYVALVIKSKDFFNDILNFGTKEHLIDTDVFMGTSTANEAAAIYEFDPTEEKASYKPRFDRSETFDFGGRIWSVRFHSTPDLDSRMDSRVIPSVALYLGILVSLLTSILIYFLFEWRDKAEKIADDITKDLQWKDIELRKINRALRTISEANQITVKAADEIKMLKDVCEVLIKNSGYKMIWVGYVRDDAEKSVEPVAWAGFTEGYIEKLKVSWADVPRGRGPTGTAVREKRIVLDPDFSKDPNFSLWREDAERRGYKGSIVLPLLSSFSGQIFGAISIYSSEANAFNEDEVEMLKELADNIAFSVLSLRNRTEKATALEKLNKKTEELQQFQSAVNNTSDHIIITDLDGYIVYANKGAERTTGYLREEMIGKRPSLWGKQMPKEFYKNMWRVIKEEKQPFTGEVINKRKDGTLYNAEFSITPILNEKGDIVYFVGVERDITKSKEIDKSKTEFVSLASHQLRTPLSAINWYTEMLLDGDAGPTNQKQAEYLKEIYGSSRRMSDLVGALLDVSRIELGTFAIEPREIDAIEIAEIVAKELQQKIKDKNQVLVKNYTQDLPKIFADPNLLELILQNLMTNAVKYTPDGGKITLTIKKDEKDVILNVEDNGYGIPVHQQERVFSKFFRADNIVPIETDGTGLGLYIVKEIIEKAGGSISFESKENIGTTFTVKIPLTGMLKKEGTKVLGENSYVNK